MYVKKKKKKNSKIANPNLTNYLVVQVISQNSTVIINIK